MAVPSFQILSFYKNQADIIAKFCENKAKPELKCDGHCYLKKQLSVEKNEQPTRGSQPEIQIFIPIAIQILSEFIISEPSDANHHSVFANVDAKENRFNSEIFAPPKKSFLV